MQEINKADVKSIDVMKFIFAVSIVVLHSRAYLWLPHSYYVEKIFIRLAVPFFFVASGYFFQISLLNGKTFKNYAMRLVVPLIGWESVNVLLETIKMSMRGEAPDFIAIDMIKHILFYPYGALWYVQASIVGAALLSRMYKKLNVALIIGACGYVFALLCNSYFFVVENNQAINSFIRWYIHTFISGRNGLFVGLFFLAIGAKCTEIDKVIDNYKFLLFAFALYVLEVFLLANKKPLDDGALYITQIILLPSILKCLLKTELRIKSSCALMLRKMSTGIYYLHRPILSIFVIIGTLTPIQVNEPLQCIFIICVGMIICFCVSKSKCRTLRRLFGYS